MQHGKHSKLENGCEHLRSLTHAKETSARKYLISLNLTGNQLFRKTDFVDKIINKKWYFLNRSKMGVGHVKTI